MSLPYVILWKNNVAAVADQTDWDEEELQRMLDSFIARGIYPVKVPLPIRNKTFETYGRERKYPDAWK